MEQLLKIKWVNVNVNILAATSDPIRPTTEQVPILALTWHETDNSVWPSSLKTLQLANTAIATTSLFPSI